MFQFFFLFPFLRFKLCCSCLLFGQTGNKNKNRLCSKICGVKTRCQGSSETFPTTNGGMQNGSSAGICTHCIHVFFARLALICMLSRCLVKTFLHRSSVGSLLKVRCFGWVVSTKEGKKTTMTTRRIPRSVGFAARCKKKLSFLSFALSPSGRKLALCFFQNTFFLRQSPSLNRRK